MRKNIRHVIYTYANNNEAANIQNKVFHGVRQGKWLRSLAVYILLCNLRFYDGFVFPRQMSALAAKNDFLNQQLKETFFFLI